MGSGSQHETSINRRADVGARDFSQNKIHPTETVSNVSGLMMNEIDRMYSDAQDNNKMIFQSPE